MRNNRLSRLILAALFAVSIPVSLPAGLPVQSSKPAIQVIHRSPNHEIRTMQKSSRLKLDYISAKIQASGKLLPTAPTPLPLLSENFEAPLSPDWEIYDWFFGIFGGYHWGIRPDPENGLNHCAWCAAGPDSLPPLQQYPDNCASWMVYGPVDLSRANWAKLHFSAWLDSESGSDFLLWAVSLDNVSFFGEGLSGNSNGWISLDFDLTAVDSLGDVTGKSQVWFAFIFYSNESGSGAGAFVDNVELRVANLNKFKVARSFPSPAPNAAGLAWNGNRLFQADHANGRIFRFDSDGSSTVHFKAWAQHPAGLDFKDNYLYVIDSQTSRIHRLDANGDEKGDSIMLTCNPWGITWQNNHLWIASNQSDTLFRFSGNFETPGFFPVQDIFEKTFTGITWDGSSLWLCDSSNSFIYQLDANGNIRDYYRSPGPHPTGIAAAGDFLWCANADSVFKLENPQPPFLDLKIVGMDLSDFPQIVSYFSIKDEMLHPVTSLPDESFSVWENGFPRTPTEMDIRNITESVGVFLVLDFSTSMSKQDTAEMKKAAHNFVDLMGPNDKGGIIQFAGDVYPAQDLTGDKFLLHQAINDQSFIFSGGTKFFDAIWTATGQLAVSPLKKAVIALTDGFDNKSDETCLSVIQQAINAGVAIHTIGLGTQTDTEVLKAIADSTGGNYYEAVEATHLDSIYQSISRVLSSDYMLTFQTRNAAKDGSRRTLLISVQDGNGIAADTVYYQAPLPENVFLYFPDSLEANFGDTVNVPIWIDDLEFTSIYGIQVNCAVDPSVLKPLRVTNSQTISEQWNLLTSKIEAGNIRFALVGTTPLTREGKLAEIVCEVVGLPGTASALVLNDVDLNEGFPTALKQNGMFYVRLANPFILGKIGYYKNFDQRPVNLCQVNLTGDAVASRTTDTAGIYEFNGLAPGSSYELTVSRQAVNDSAVTPGDALQVLRHLVEGEKLTPAQMIAADLTGDSTVSLLDASLILRYFLNPNLLLPGNGWKFVPAEFPLDSTNWHSAPNSLIFSPFESTLVKQDFWGVRLGDVNGDWHLAAESSLLAKENPLPFSQLFVAKMTRTIQNVLNFEMNLAGGVDAFGLSFFIPPQLEFLAIQSDGFAENFLIQHEQTENVLRLAGAGINPPEAQPRLVLTFQFKAVQTYEAVVPIRIIDYCYNHSLVFPVNQPVTWAPAAEIPEKFVLLPNFPNPFNAETIVRYQLPEKTHVTLKIYNSLGQVVRTLVDFQKPAGYFEVVWDGKDDQQQALSSGIYLCHFQAGLAHQVQKMVLLR